MLGLFQQDADKFLTGDSSSDQLAVDIDGLVAERNQARADKNWARADEIRDQLGLSKKVFKKALGGLYKNGLVKLGDQKVTLIKGCD